MTDERSEYQVDAASIGVVGDHIHVEGGIHFHEAAPPPSLPFMVESIE